MTPSSILKGTAILLFLQGVSTVALNLCGIKFPPALLAMILLLVLLLSGVIRVRTIEDVCDILIEKMGMLFCCIWTLSLQKAPPLWLPLS